MMMNQLPNPNDLMMNTMRGGHHEEIPKPPPANRRKKLYIYLTLLTFQFVLKNSHDF